MNYKVTCVGGAGIFSIFMDLLIMNIYDLEDAESFEIKLQWNEYNCPTNGFDFVFEQSHKEPFKHINGHYHQRISFRKKGVDLGAIEDFKDLDKIRNVCKVFKIKPEILSKVLKQKNMLGVHFRGGDMDIKHPQYGIFKINDYLNKIDKILSENEVSSIFIASDNIEAANIIIDRYDNKVPVFYFTEFVRANSLTENTEKIQIKNSSTPRFWQEAFIDMLSLAQCKYLLCRTSNFSSAAIAFSNTLTKIYRL